ncbi:MAG: hypothetical protein AB2556_26720, partial [Candidatus Thiodiazotropha sp.]
MRLGPKILGNLGLDAASGVISGSTQRAVSGLGRSAYVLQGLTLSAGQNETLARVLAGGKVTLRLAYRANGTRDPQAHHSADGLDRRGNRAAPGQDESGGSGEGVDLVEEVHQPVVARVSEGPAHL